MPTKAELYSQLASDTARRLTGNWERWADFLSLAGRLYKYPYSDQLLIYAQRPDATACAEYDVWNNRMNRFVRRGSKGIALLDDSSGTPHLRYVFDVSDTGTRRNSLDPDLWQMDYSFREPVAAMLAKTYGVSDPNFAQQLADLSGKLVEDYWDNNAQDIRDIVDGSLLEGYDDLGLEMEFKSAGAISITWLLLSRCGIDPEGWFDREERESKQNNQRPPARTRSCSAGGIVLLLTRRSAQPVIFNHSSRGLGHGPNKHFAFVYTKALLAGTAYRKTPVSIFTSDFSWKKPRRRTSARHYTSESMHEKEETHLRRAALSL